MGKVTAGVFLQHIRRLIPADLLEQNSDSDLLRRYAVQHDEAAFAALVHRHGPMVWNACRRAVRDYQDAEDVFQATFLVLARKAGAVRWRDSVAGWLYAVALRLAAKSRCQAARRPHPAPVEPAAPDPFAALSARDLLAALDEEMAALPGRLRSPAVLCWLEGRTQPEAARLLGVSLSTLWRRLERGKQLLHARLARRGLTLAVALAAPALADAVPATTLAAAARGGTATPRAAALAESLLASAVRKMRAGLVLFAACVITAGIGLAASVPQEQPPQTARPERPAPRPRLDRHGDPLPPDALARLGTLRFRLGTHLRGMGLSPNGKTAISVGLDQTAFWDLTTGKVLRRIDAKQGGGGHAVAYSPNGRLAASVPDKGTLHLWDTATGKQLAKLGLKMNGTDCLTFAPDGLVLAAGGYSANYGAPVEKHQTSSVVSVWRWTGEALKPLWETKPDKSARRGRRPEGIRSLAFSPDGKYLATGGLANSIIRIWDVAQGKEVAQMKASGTLTGALAFAPGSTTLASGTDEGAVELWEPATGKKRWQSKQGGQVLTLAFAPDGKALVAGGGLGPWWTAAKQNEPFLVVLDSGGGREVRRIRTDSSSVASVAFSTDGKTLAAGLGGSIRVWDTVTGEERSTPAGHDNVVACVAVSEDGKTALTAGMDGVIVLWDLARGTEIRRLRGHQGWVRAAGFVPGGKYLASASSDQTVRLWDLATGDEVRRLAGNPEGFLYALALAPDGKTLASGDNHLDGVDVWDLETGQRRHALKFEDGQGRGVVCLAFSPDGKTLACGERMLRYDEADFTCRILLWDATTGKKRGAFLAHKFAVESLTFSPDGKVLASTGTSDNKVALWDVDTGTPLFEWPCGSGRGVAVFSPDGKTLAWGSSGGEMRLWETASKKPRRTVTGHSTAVKSLAFSPDGRTLVSGSEDTTALVWDVTGIKRIATAPPPFSPDRLRSLWSALADPDAAEAGRAVWAFTADPQRSVPFLVTRLRGLSPVTKPQRIPKLVADLDSAIFQDRQTAMKELEVLGKLAEPALREVLARGASLEVRRRIERVLAKRETPIQAPELLRAVRALEALECVGSPEARRGLEEVAQLASERYIREEANAAAARLAKRGPNSR
jgi:RNA polymerase sigma factor (sigma-70 family)